MNTFRLQLIKRGHGPLSKDLMEELLQSMAEGKAHTLEMRDYLNWGLKRALDQQYDPFLLKKKPKADIYDLKTNAGEDFAVYRWTTALMEKGLKHEKALENAANRLETEGVFVSLDSAGQKYKRAKKSLKCAHVVFEEVLINGSEIGSAMDNAIDQALLKITTKKWYSKITDAELRMSYQLYKPLLIDMHTDSEDA